MKNKNKITVFIIVIVLIFIGLFFFSQPGKKENKKIDTISETVSSLSLLQVNESPYNFGSISMRDGNVSKVFKIENKTDVDVFIPNLATSCMCTTAYFLDAGGEKSGPFGMLGMGFVPKLNKTIKAGEAVEVEVVYDPNAHGPAGVGMIDRFVYLSDDSGEKLELEIKANVTP